MYVQLIRIDYQFYNLSLFQVVGFYRLKRSSSCSTIFIDDCTVSHPDFKNMIKCVSMAVYYHIHSRRTDVVLDIFDERTHPLDVSILYEHDIKIIHNDYSLYIEEYVYYGRS